MKEILLTKGKVALVDDEDFDRVNQFKWAASRGRGDVWYAKRFVSQRNYVVTYQRLQNFILPCEILIDHIDCDGLNNQRHNLRPATHAQNNANQRKQLGRSSVFKGVSWNPRNRNWNAHITHERVKIHLGCYESEIAAAHSYDYAAKIYFGEFARLNFPE